MTSTRRLKQCFTIAWIAVLVVTGIYAALTGRGEVRLAPRFGPEPASLESGEAFTFAVLGDTHAFRKPLTETLRRAREDQSRFVIQLGDFVDYDDPAEYRDFANTVIPLTRDLPLFLVRGNHETMALDGTFSDNYLKWVPKPATVFRYGGCLFGILDNSSGSIHLQELNWLARHLSDFRRKHPKGLIFLFMHMPPDLPDSPSPDMSDENSEALLTLARRFKVAAIFAGHLHADRELESGKTKIFISGSGGGSIRAPSPETHFLEVQVDGQTYNVRKVPVDRESSAMASLRYATAILIPRYRVYVIAAVALLLAIEVASVLRNRKKAPPPNQAEQAP